jgi:hypothetical protein
MTLNHESTVAKNWRISEWLKVKGWLDSYSMMMADTF